MATRPAATAALPIANWRWASSAPAAQGKRALYSHVCGDGKVEGSRPAMMATPCQTTVLANLPLEPNCSSPRDLHLEVRDGWSSARRATMGIPATATVARRLVRWSPASSALSPIPPPTHDRAVTYRDFLVGGDFHAADVSGSNNAVTACPGHARQRWQAGLRRRGRRATTAGWVTTAASFHNWYRDVPGTNTTYVSKILLHNNGSGAFVNW